MDAVKSLAISTGRSTAEVRQMLRKLGFGISAKEQHARIRLFVEAVNGRRKRA